MLDLSVITAHRARSIRALCFYFMNISQGFEIEQPKVFVPWGITEKALLGLVKSSSLRHVTKGHFSLSCISLGGLSHELSFHFMPRVDGKLKELELYLKGAQRQPLALTQSFKRLQRHVEAIFGPPTIVNPIRKSYQEYSYTWNLKGVRIEHHIRKRIWDADVVRIIKD